MGPAAVVCSQVPDLHHFSGRGAKDVIPLWRDADGTEANLTRGLLEVISKELDKTVSAEDIFAYTYAILSAPDYVATFSEELTIPGPRIPITKNLNKFTEAVDLGRKLIWLHTYGERMVPEMGGSGVLPQGKTRCIKGVPGTTEDYPEEFSYEDAKQLLRVGKGEFAPVPKAVFEFSVSGLFVVKSWLRYRMKAGAGKSSSPLDEIRPDVWTAQMTHELLELLWVLEATVELHPKLGSLLKDICGSDLFKSTELPATTQEERRPPTSEDTPTIVQDDLPTVMGESHEFYGTPNNHGTSQSSTLQTHVSPTRSRHVNKSGPVREDLEKSLVYCPKCKQFVLQTPIGELEVKRKTATQSYVCSICNRHNRVESTVH